MSAEPVSGRGRRGRPAVGRRVMLIAKRGRFLVAEPFFERGAQVMVEKGRDGGRARRAEPGRLALVETGPGRASVLRALGDPASARDVVEALMLDRGLARRFDTTVEADAAAAAGRLAADPGPRHDLTALATFTVDPATARDFDDAVSAAAEGDGLRLWIHIADVAAHVRPGTALDGEAYRRATSTYVPGAVEPMLPPALSESACSLGPGALRPAVTAEIVLSAGGDPVSARFFRSLIRSDARLDYDQLDDIFAGRASPPAEVAEPLALARVAATALAAKRSAAALVVESSEPEFEFDAAGAVLGARRVAQTEAHGLIEQLMILANEQVAALLERKRIATLYRVHEQPDPARIEFLLEQLAALEVPTPPAPETLSPRQAGELAGAASRLVRDEAARRGSGGDALGSLVLRSLKQAYYSDRNLGHAGLGSVAYAHFTSPIRRYPDLIAHRALLAAVGEGEDAPRTEQVREAGWHCSAREREATAIERSADDVCAAFLLERELFDSGWERSFEGEVSGVIGAGAFVSFGGSLGAVYEGFLPARRLAGERFELNETQTALVGRRSGRALRLGDPVPVRVEAVEAARGRVDLIPGPPSASAQRGGREPGGAGAQRGGSGLAADVARQRGAR